VGVTLQTLHDWRRAPVGVDDVRNLTQDEAREIYKSLYWTKGGFDQVRDPDLQEFLFDTSVNSGLGEAAKCLQAALHVSADGVTGPQTLTALAVDANPKALYHAAVAARALFLLRIVGHNPSQSVFAEGWANRVQAFNDR
jgi:lysozyme family protein